MVAFKKPEAEERTTAMREFIKVLAAGHIPVAGPETAERLNAAFKRHGLPYRVEVFDMVQEGTVYALLIPPDWPGVGQPPLRTHEDYGGHNSA